MSWEVSTMRSRKSYFNPVLYRKNLARFWPLWGGVSLVGCVVPLYMLLMLLSYSGAGFHIENNDASSAIYSVVSVIVPAGLLVYAALCGVLCWGYLTNSRSVGLYHTLPVSRTCLFLTTVASGLTMMLVPFVIVGGLSVLVLLGWGVFPLKALVWGALSVIGMSLLFFSLITFSAMVSGNSFAVLAFYFLGNFLAPALDWLLTSFARGFLFGVGSDYTGSVEFFSPVFFLYRHLGVERLNDEYVLQGTWVIGVYVLVGLAILAVSLLLYHRRRSESAGDVVAQGWLKPIFRYGVALLFGLTLGQVLYEFVYALPFGTSQYKRMVPMAICVVVTAVVGYYVASMLLKKSLRVFRGSWKGALTTVAMVVILCGCVSFDIFGSVGYVPDLEDVEEVSVYGVAQAFHTPGDSALAKQVTDLHRAILADEAYIRDMTDQSGVSYYGYSYDTWDTRDTNSRTLYLEYVMKNGATVQRQYHLPLVKDRWDNQPDTYDYKLRQTSYGPEAAVARVTPEHGGTPDSLYAQYRNDDGSQELSLNGDAARKIYAAVLEDAAAGCILSDDVFGDGGSSYLCTMEFYFRYQEEGDGLGDYHQESVYVDLDFFMSSTKAALEEVSPEWYAGLLEANGVTSVSLGTAVMET